MYINECNWWKRRCRPINTLVLFDASSLILSSLTFDCLRNDFHNHFFGKVHKCGRYALRFLCLWMSLVRLKSNNWYSVSNLKYGLWGWNSPFPHSSIAVGRLIRLRGLKPLVKGRMSAIGLIARLFQLIRYIKVANGVFQCTTDGCG